MTTERSQQGSTHAPAAPLVELDDASDWLVGQLTAAAEAGGRIAGALGELSGLRAWSWMTSDQFAQFGGRFAADVSGATALFDQAVRGLSEAMPLAVNAGPDRIAALVFEDPGEAGSGESPLPPGTFSAEVGQAAFHVVDAPDPRAIEDALVSLAMPWGAVGILTQVDRPARFRGRRTSAELQAICARASAVIVPAWDTQGFIMGTWSSKFVEQMKPTP